MPREDGYYHLHTDAEDSPALAYLYSHPQTRERGFGFNTADGGGFLPECHVAIETKIRKVTITED